MNVFLIVNFVSGFLISKFVVMKQKLVINCEIPDRVHVSEFKTIYTNSLEVDDALNFDFIAFYRVLKILYPYNDLIINLKLF